MPIDRAYQAIRGFLGSEMNLQLLRYVVARVWGFQQSTIGKTRQHDPAFRVSGLLRDLGFFKAVIEQRILALVLRLYSFPGVANRPDEQVVDVTPEQVVAVAFSSWMPHEVLPVSRHSRLYSDSYFSINCWMLRARTHAGPIEEIGTT